eukprot:763379-Hanusia_phi.AAC.10
MAEEPKDVTSGYADMQKITVTVKGTVTCHAVVGCPRAGGARPRAARTHGPESPAHPARLRA